MVTGQPVGPVVVFTLTRLNGKPVGKRGVISSNWAMTAGGTFVTLVPANPSRVFCHIQNIDDTDFALIQFVPNKDVGYSGALTGYGFRVFPHGSLQIDQNLPWDGAINVACLAGGPQLQVTEVSDAEAL